MLESADLAVNNIKLILRCYYFAFMTYPFFTL